MIKEEIYLEKTRDKDGVILITEKKRLVEVPEYIHFKKPSSCVKAKCCGSCSLEDIKAIECLGLTPYECSFYKINTDDYRNVIKLCQFAKEATNKDDEYSAGMRAAFDYVIKCLEEGCVK